MDDFIEPTNDLEHALAAVGLPGEDEDGAKRRRVLVRLAAGTATVLLKEPWTEEGVPDAAAQPMYVSDEGNLEQAMLAVFTNAERALAFERQYGGFEHPCTVPGPWVIGSVIANAGIMINPNQPLGFRIVAGLVETLRKDVANAMERARERARNEGAPS
ncbi:MAG: hypothetical protein ACREFZ_09395 [Acetobacteraceae bacterium]